MCIRDRDDAKEYGRVHAFHPRRTLRLFKMSRDNLERIIRDNPRDAELARVIRGVTGVGLRPGNRYREWDKFNNTVVPKAGKHLRTTLFLHTSGHLSMKNIKTMTYSSKRLALELRRILVPLGFDGWVYGSEHKRVTQAAWRRGMADAGGAFHREVMLWKAPSLVQETVVAKRVT